VIEAFSEIDCISPQDDSFQHQFKVSYLMDSNHAIGRLALQRLLREKGISAKVIVTAKTFVDVIPIRSGKDVAIRYIENSWGINPSRIFYFGTYGNDMSAVRGRNISVLAGDADRVLRSLHSRPRLYHAKGKGLEGLFEGLDHFEFLEGAKPPKYDEKAGKGEEDVPAVELHP
jgi:sucrose-phosphate synthase